MGHRQHARVVASVDPALGAAAGELRHPGGHAGISRAEVPEDGDPRSHTAEVVLADCGSQTLSARCKEKLDERMARAREGKKSSVQAAMATFEASRPLVGLRRSVSRVPRTSTRSTTRRTQAVRPGIIENQAIAFKLRT